MTSQSSLASSLESPAIAGEQLKSFIDRLEHMEEEKSQLLEHIRSVYEEAKSVGFDVKVMRQIIRLRKKDAQRRAEEQELLDLYCSALGMV